MALIKKLQFIIIIGVLAFSFALVQSANAIAVNQPCGICSQTAVIGCLNNTDCTVGTCDVPVQAADECDDPGLRCIKDNGELKCQERSDLWGDKNADQLAAGAGLGTSDPRDIISAVINVLLGFLGIIAVVLILYGGFLWMTAAGNDDKVATAKNLMIAGVIGMVIVLAAFGVSKFVVEALLGATGATT